MSGPATPAISPGAAPYRPTGWPALDLPGLPKDPWAQEDCVYGAFPGGHVIIYRIPDGHGGHRANWVLYTAPPAGLALRLDSPGSLPPGTLTEPLHARFRAGRGRAAAALLGRTDPADTGTRSGSSSRSTTSPRRATARDGSSCSGDAATVARPHTGAGAVKALQDAVALESALRALPKRPDALTSYGAERGAAGREMVELGRRLGRSFVQDTPDWRTIDPG